MTDPLCVLSEKRKNELIEALNSSNYEYGVSVVAVANPIPGPLDAVKVDLMPGQRRADVFLRKEFDLTFVEGRRVAPSFKGLRTLVSQEPGRTHSPSGRLLSIHLAQSSLPPMSY